MVNESKTFTFSKDEINTLLADTGLKKWCGPVGSNAGTALNTKEKLNAVLAGLYRDGVISWGEGRIIPEGILGAYLDTIKNSKNCIVTAGKESLGRRMVSYSNGDQCVVISPSDAEKGSFMMRGYSAVEWADLLMDEMTSWSDYSLENDFDIGDEAALYSLDKSIDEVIKAQDVTLVIDRLDAGTFSVVKRLVIREHGVSREAVVLNKASGVTGIGSDLKSIRDEVLSWVSEPGGAE